MICAYALCRDVRVAFRWYAAMICPSAYALCRDVRVAFRWYAAMICPSAYALCRDVRVAFRWYAAMICPSAYRTCRLSMVCRDEPAMYVSPFFRVAFRLYARPLVPRCAIAVSLLRLPCRFSMICSSACTACRFSLMRFDGMPR